MSLYQGLLGAQIELAALPPSARLRRAAAIAKLFASELAGTVALAPYAKRASSLHRGLLPTSTSHDGVALERGVRYGPAPRAVADIYLPPPHAPVAPPTAASSSATTRATGTGGRPCVVFVHGGVWAAGEAWHYAPMCAALARLGVVTYCVTYSLYPDALVPALVGEVAAALAFAMDDAPRRGADPSRLALVGHSAGAHLAAMACLYKAAAAAGVKAGAVAAAAAARAEAAEREGGWASPGPPAAATATARLPAAAAAAAAAAPAGAGHGEPNNTNSDGGGGGGEEEEDDFASVQDPPSTVDELLLHPAVRDPRMPALLVGAAGMYDASKHYHFERLRGVHELSTLKRAMGGADRFAAMSPAAILGAATARRSRAAAAAAAAALADRQRAVISSDPLDATRFFETAVGQQQQQQQREQQQQQRQREQPHAPAEPPPPPPAPTPWQLAGEAIAHRVGLDRESPGYARRDVQLAGELALAGMRDVLPFPVPAGAALLPPSVLMHALGDTTVPFDESTEMHRRLLDAGASSKVLLYRGKGVGHASFVLDWPPAAGSKRWLGTAAAGERQPQQQEQQGAGQDDDDDDDEEREWWELASELPAHCRDLALIVTGRASIDFCRPEAAAAAAAEIAQAGGAGV